MYFRLTTPTDPDPDPRCRAYGHTVRPLSAAVDSCAECGQRFPVSARPAPAVVDLDALASILAAHAGQLPADVVAELLAAVRAVAVLVPAGMLTPAPVPVPA